MINAQDLETFKRFLGVDEVPEKFARKYAAWQKAFHSDGHSGPLGTMGIICLLDSCGHRFPQPAPEPPVQDWNKVRKGWIVEAMFHGNWEPGEFMHFGDYGIPVVKFKYDGIARECHRYNLRIVGESAPTPKMEPIAEKAVETPIETPPAEQPKEYADVTQAFSSWNQQPEGIRVWVDIDNDIKDGKFCRIHDEPEQIVVEIDGVEQIVSTGVVTISEPATA